MKKGFDFTERKELMFVNSFPQSDQFQKNRLYYDEKGN